MESEPEGEGRGEAGVCGIQQSTSWSAASRKASKAVLGTNERYYGIGMVVWMQTVCGCACVLERARYRCMCKKRRSSADGDPEMRDRGDGYVQQVREERKKTDAYDNVRRNEGTK